MGQLKVISSSTTATSFYCQCQCYFLFSIANNDYNLMSVQLTFQRGSVQECNNITIFSDNVLENVEKFLVQLNTDDPNTSTGQGSVTVSILDNNGN